MFWRYTHIGDKNHYFKKLFKEYYPSLMHFATQMLKNTHDAEDVVQDVFMNIWKKKPTFDSETSFKAYLYLSVRNKALDFLKKKSPVYAEASFFENIEQEVELLIKEEAFRQLDAAIELLPDRTRQVIRLSLEDYSVKEVAQKLEITTNTVKTLKARAYKFLKEQCGGILLFLLFSLALHENCQSSSSEYSEHKFFNLPREISNLSMDALRNVYLMKFNTH